MIVWVKEREAEVQSEWFDWIEGGAGACSDTKQRQRCFSDPFPDMHGYFLSVGLPVLLPLCRIEEKTPAKKLLLNFVLESEVQRGESRL